ncbi:Putative mycofactocin radical SAM maturase MftC [Thermoflexales bacterium]|nr:Putative mycofactocin radical SAM maturase MftC [Thermoflexales bacterium]
MGSLSVRLLRARNTSRGAQFTVRLLTFYISQLLEHGTPRRWANALLAKVQKHLRRDKVWAMPYRYTIDPLNVCNLRCPLCPTGLGTLKRERGKMKLADFQTIIDQIAPYALLVELYNWGEPFLHPDIFQMIQYASRKRIAVRLSSNLNHFTPEMAEKAVRVGLDALIVDVDGATEEVYQKYRKNGELKKVLANLRTLVETKKRLGSRKPFIVFRTLINRYNEHQIEDLRALSQEIGADAFTTGTIFIDTKSKTQAEEWLPQDGRLSYYDYSKPLKNVWHCADLWESLTINWDGGMAPCCWLHDKSHDLENALARPIKDIWNGAAYVSSRRVFAPGGLKAGPQTTICAKCKGRPEYLNW